MKTSSYIAVLATICVYQINTKDAPKIEKNNYDDLIITLEKDHSTKEVSRCIEQHGKPDKPIFIHIPNSDLIEKLVAQGFCEFHSNNEKRILVKRVSEDDVPPEPFTCNAGAKVLITREKDGEQQMLLTKEKREGGHIYWLLPGGMSKRGEKTLTTALRELKEEIGMKATHEQLTLLGILQKQYGGYGAMHHLYIYHAQYNSEKIAPDGEVLDIVWVPIKQVLQEGAIRGTPVSPERLQLLHDIRNGKKGTPCVHMLDPNKKNTSEINKDARSVMDFYPANR